MSIPQEAIDAAAEAIPGIPTDSVDLLHRRNTTQAMLTAALPHLREQIAQEIEAIPNNYPAGPRNIWAKAMTTAARIVRGES